MDTHNLHLNSGPFEMIKSGQKTIEMRLFDEKRQLIKVGDYIIFDNRTTNETLKTKVVALHKFPSFKQLYDRFDKTVLGYKTNEHADCKDMEQYYTKEEQNKYGIVGIEINLIK